VPVAPGKQIGDEVAHPAGVSPAGLNICGPHADGAPPRKCAGGTSDYSGGLSGFNRIVHFGDCVLGHAAIIRCDPPAGQPDTGQLLDVQLSRQRFSYRQSAGSQAVSQAVQLAVQCADLDRIAAKGQGVALIDGGLLGGGVIESEPLGAQLGPSAASCRFQQVEGNPFSRRPVEVATWLPASLHHGPLFAHLGGGDGRSYQPRSGNGGHPSQQLGGGDLGFSPG